MKILVISQYFWPENFRINQIVKNLSRNGHVVEVLTAQPNYPDGKLYQEYKNNSHNFDYFEGCKIHRVKIKTRGQGSNYEIFLNYFTFFFNAAFYIIKNFKRNNFDLIFVFGTSPITVSLLSFLPTFNNAKKAIWVLDLWPEILFELKVINNYFLKLIIKKIVTYIYNKNDLIFVQSQSFFNNIIKKVKNINKVKILFSWPEISHNNISNNKKNKISKEFKKKYLNNFKKNHLNILFAGNVGWAQNFKFISRMIIDLQKNKKFKIAWHILGSGRYISEIDKLFIRINVPNVYFYKYLPFDKVKKFCLTADIFLLPLAAGEALNSTIPGKFQTYLIYEKPILGSISGECMNLIKEYNLGLVSKPNDEKNFKKNVKLFYKKKIDQKYLPLKIDSKKILKLFSLKTAMNTIYSEFNDLINASKISLRLLTKPGSLSYSKNFILSAINLAFLGYYANRDLLINKNYLFWPDGYFYKKVFKKKGLKKISGRNILSNLNIPYKIKHIHVIGNMSANGYNYLKKKYPNKNILHTPLPYSEDLNFLSTFIPKFKHDELSIITLPTPKQENIANILAKKNEFFKIMCMGAALNMLSGDETPVPYFMEKSNLEFLWRLKFDTKRRTMRLLKSFYLYYKHSFKGFYKKILVSYNE